MTTMNVFPASMTYKLWLVVLVFSYASEAWAEIVIERPWSRATIGMSRPGVAYMKIKNFGNAQITLSDINTEHANQVTIHQTSTTAEGITSMTPIDRITINPGETVSLEPGGLHAMLTGLLLPLKVGESFTLILSFSDGTRTVVDVPILSIGSRGPES